jgi:hypothetical protein
MAAALSASTLAQQQLQLARQPQQALQGLGGLADRAATSLGGISDLSVPDSAAAGGYSGVGGAVRLGGKGGAPHMINSPCFQRTSAEFDGDGDGGSSEGGPRQSGSSRTGDTIMSPLVGGHAARR